MDIVNFDQDSPKCVLFNNVLGLEKHELRFDWVILILIRDPELLSSRPRADDSCAYHAPWVTQV